MKKIIYCLSIFLWPVFLLAQKAKLADLSAFYKPVSTPILKADSSLVFYDSLKKAMVKWQKADVFNPAAVVKNGKVYLFTRSEDNPAAILGGRTSRIGLAVSSDGIHFKHFSRPVLFPDNSPFKQYDYPGGCEDPRVVETADGRYVMAFTAWNYDVPRLSIAMSKDLFHWTKKGPAFAVAYKGKFLNMASKSASMVTKMRNGRPILAKINNKYWMYWGEHFVNLAWSTNLSDWYPLVDNDGKLRQAMITRPGMFDSDLTECGPPALVTDKGILLLYNGKNAENEKADTSLPKGTYSVGEAVFDINDMEKVVFRTDTCLLRPSLPHEITGQYAAGTTFSEGLVYFKDKWYLYYGTADSFIGVAIAK
ncbi:glycoside hydrolase family 130 protein [Ferruginibacter paludis]|uniref:glycoside hydrolase family 130 protein n=1 Tax=Ferruginibacter paludis TaxID=1310417 RepID=UPI0025B5A6E1|nr:glycoside hydrolase family 130 protein [Ferruginibacter paludis]MDN3658851.1 glycoside hydrolase family 130 protein [Ferruginibacter paludis]